MVSVHRSTVFDAPLEAVWSIVRDFNGWPAWHTSIDTSEIEGGGSPDAVGAVRLLSGLGMSTAEKLLGLSDHEHAVTYSLEWATDLPISDYVATLRLHRVTDGDRTFADWRGTFTADADQAAALADTVTTWIYDAGFAGLRAVLDHRTAASH